MNKDLNYQLGYLAAEYYIVTELPTLSTDMIKSNNVIEVSENLTKQWDEKQKDYINNNRNKNIFYENLKWYKENIKDIYLKPELRIRIPKVHPTNLEEFGKGFEQALWDCDISYYSYDEFLPNEKLTWCSIIKLKYNE